MTGRHVAQPSEAPPPRERARIRRTADRPTMHAWTVDRARPDDYSTVVHPSFALALDDAQRTPGHRRRRFLPIGWKRVRIVRKFEAPVYEWRFLWRCLACGRHVGSPAVHNCMPVIGAVPVDYRPRRPGRRYDWTSHIGLG